MRKLGVIVLALLRSFICSVDNPLRRLRESSALQLKVKKQIRFINMENELKKLTYKKSLIEHDWLLSCSLCCAPSSAASIIRSAGSANHRRCS